MNIGQKIKALRGKLSQKEFAALIGTDAPNISRYESGDMKPSYEVLGKICKKLGINAGWLFDSALSMYETDLPAELIEKYGRNLKRVPEIAFADCGLPSTQWEQTEKDFIVITGLKNYKKLFAFRASGDSMTPYINKNDLLICAEVPFDTIKDYTAVIIIFKSGPESLDASLKLFYRSRVSKDYIFIYSINTKHPPKEINLETVDKIYKLVRIVRDVA